MKIDDKLLKKLSQLCALRFSLEEARQMKEYLKDTLSHFEKIKKLDTKTKGPAMPILSNNSESPQEKKMGKLKQDEYHFEDSQRATEPWDTEEIQGLVNPLSGPCLLREDKEVSFPDKERLLKQAPRKQGALVKAPPTV